MPAVGVVSRIITQPHNGAAIAAPDNSSSTTGVQHAAPRPTSHRRQSRTNGGATHRNSNAGVASAWQEEPASGGANHHHNNNNFKYDNKFRQSYPPPADPQSQQMSAYRRWLAKNRVGQSQPSSFNVARKAAAAAAAASATSGSKLLRDARNSAPKYRESPGAAAILYLGIGMIAIGLVITIVGLGDDVFKTLALKLIGPTLVSLGVLVCAIRVMVCFCCADRCQLCDRPIEYPDSQKERLKSVSLKSWRPDSRSVVKEKKPATPSSAGASTSTTTETRRPPSARITLERGEQRAANMATGSGIHGHPFFTSPTPSFQDFSTTSSSGSGTRPGSTRSSPDPSVGLSSLHSDDIGNLLNEFKEIELQRATSHHHRAEVVADPAHNLPEPQVPTDNPIGNVQVPPPPASAKNKVPLHERTSSGSARERPRVSSRAQNPPPEVHSGLTTVISSPEMTSPELEVQRFLQMELQKVFQFDLPAFSQAPKQQMEVNKPEVTTGSANGQKVQLPEADAIPAAAQQKELDSLLRDKTEVTHDTETERFLAQTLTTSERQQQETEVEEIFRNTEKQMSPDTEAKVDVVREEEVQRALQSAEMGKVLRDVKLAKILPGSGNGTYSQSPKTSAQQTRSTSLRLSNPNADSTRRDLNAGILLNPNSLVQINNGQFEDSHMKR